MERSSRFARITIFVCFISIYVGLISATWAGKPQTYDTEYGYAMLENSSSYGIWNDNAGQYMDINKGGEDLVELEVYNSNRALRSVHAFLGKPELPYRSSRRVEFNFSIDEITEYDTYYNNYLENKAVYDILKLAESQFCNNIIHTDISAYPGSKLRVQFVVDPGCTADSPLAITQASVDAFYDGDANPTYWTAKIAESSTEADAHEHIIYTLYYKLPFSVAGTYPAFTIETSGSATLAVGRLKGRKSGSHEIVYLAECDVPFKLTVVSLGINAAPGKHDMLSTTWGEIKY